MRLLPEGVGRIVGGSIHFEGRDLATLSEREMRRIRGNRMSMIFQEPMTSLNPVLTVGDQIAESLRTHQGLGSREGRERAVEQLSLVGHPDPPQRAGDSPTPLSAATS